MSHMHRRAMWTQKWKRGSNKYLSDLLLTVGVIVSTEAVRYWTDSKYRNAEWWAATTHMLEIGNPVRQDTKPEFLKKYPLVPRS